MERIAKIKELLEEKKALDVIDKELVVAKSDKNKKLEDRYNKLKSFFISAPLYQKIT